MFENGLAVPEVQQLVHALPQARLDIGDSARIDLIRALEQLKAAAAAVQAEVTADFVASQRAAQEAAGMPADRVGRGIAAQVGLAKRESHHRARRYCGWARALSSELPHTLAALKRGETTEWRAMLVARETGWLSVEARAVVDAEVGPRLASMGDRQVEAAAKRAAYRLDPHGYVARCRGAAKDRRVSVRPAPEAMGRLTGFLPVAQAVACYAALKKHADTVLAGGDDRSRGQIMADTLVERVTGQATATAVPVTVNLLMTDKTLLNRRGAEAPDRTQRAGSDAGADEPVDVDGYGPIPADLARRLLADMPSGTPMWLRRLYTRPDSGQLVAMESKGRLFDDELREFLILRDQVCRTPWCGAPVRHADHAVPYEDGGATSATNGQGLCEACNYAKQAPGWRARPSPAGAGDHVTVTTPTGHTYTSRPPDPVGASPPASAARQSHGTLNDAA